jgi:carbohydrate-binding DOMON domain-containing protein
LVDSIYLVSTHDLIQSVSPYDGEQGVSISTSITLRFRRRMDTESVENAFHLTPTVEGSFRWYAYPHYDPYYGPYELRFTPSEPLATGTTYEVTIDATASDTSGIGLSEPYTFSFTTESVGIVNTSPGNNETWVSPRTIVVIRFNADMDLNSADSAFRMVDSELSRVTGDFVWRSGLEMAFHPHSYLAVDEKYSVTIDTTAMAIGGAKLPDPYEFSFTTQPLLVEHTSPQHKESWVSPSAHVWVYFNTDMDMESLNSAFEMVDSEENNVAGEIVWSNPSYFQFVPDSPLALNEVYTVTIAASAADMYGKTLGQAYSFWFKTRSE